MNTTTQFNQSNNSSGFSQYISKDKMFGYIHEFKRIPNIEQSRYVVKVSVPLGSSGTSIFYETFELYIKDADALMTFMDNQEHINNKGVKTTIRFKCGKIRSKAYIAESGERAGQAISYMSGHLNYLFTMKVNGETVHGYQGRELGLVDTKTGEVKNLREKDSSDGSVADTHSETPPAESIPVEAYEADANVDSVKSKTPRATAKGRKPPKRQASRS